MSVVLNIDSRKSLAPISSFWMVRLIRDSIILNQAQTHLNEAIVRLYAMRHYTRSFKRSLF